jgi:hypothetical protein
MLQCVPLFRFRFDRGVPVEDSGTSYINVAWWNLQRLFGLDPSPIATELGVSSINGWDRPALEAKVDSLARTIGSMFDEAGPDLLGIAEIENRQVGELLLTALRRDDYRIVVAEHPQVESTGTALIYSTRVFDEQLTRVSSHFVHQRFPTCDILEVRLRARKTNADLALLLNHWPSRMEPHSSAFRRTIASYCSRLIERYLKLARPDFLELRDTELAHHQLLDRWNTNLLVMGSFNDNPWQTSIRDILNAGYSFLETREVPVALRKGLPSWRAYSASRAPLFNPSWQLLSVPDQRTSAVRNEERTPAIYDQMMLSRSLLTGQSGLQVVADATGIPQLRCLETSTLTDSRGNPSGFDCETHAGFSDRLPLGLTLNLRQTADLMRTRADAASEMSS